MYNKDLVYMYVSMYHDIYGKNSSCNPVFISLITCYM